MNTPSRQLPSLITLGESTTAATVRPLTSVPSTSPLFTLKTSTTLQRSWVAASANDAVHGHTTSHEHVSKYDPSSFQDMRGLRGDKRGNLSNDSPRRGVPSSTTRGGTTSFP